MTLDPEQLHVIRCYERLPPQRGGMEQHIAALTAAQRRQGVRVTEMFNSGQPAGEAIQVLRGWQVDRVRPAFLRAAIFCAGIAAKRIDFSDGRVRVLHIHGDWQVFKLAGPLQRRFGAHLVAASLHSAEHAPIGRYVRSLRNCDVVFSTGLAQCRRLSEAMPQPVIHLPSAPADCYFGEPAFSSRPTDVIAAGSLLPVKNLDVLLRCAALRPWLRFTILGEGPERARLERMKARLGLDNVTFRMAASREEVHSAFCSARLFINTSHSEGSPTAALEAMACRLPVVIAPSNDYSAIIEQGVNGTVTNGWDPDLLARAIDDFLENPDRLLEAGAAARRTAGGHRWIVKARTVTELMATLIEKR